MPSAVSINFEKGKGVAIAKVKGGEMNGDVLYLHQDGNKGKGGVQELEVGNKLRSLPARKQVEVMRILQEAFARGIPPEHLSSEVTRIPGVVEAYAEMSGSAKQESNTRVKLPDDSHFELIPSRDPKKREVWYIAGASGSGKSHIAKGLAEQYMKQYPDRQVYLVSKLEQDDTLDSMKGRQCIRLKPAKLVEKPIKTTEDMEKLRDTMVIFDDYDSFTGKEAKTIQQLMDDIATMGRHMNITMLCLTHYLTNYAKTRLLLTEATQLVLYPLSTGASALAYVLKTYLGMEKAEIQHLKSTGSRWVCIFKNYPCYVITENEAYLLHDTRGGEDATPTSV
jgi:hypothetical protein